MNDALPRNAEGWNPRELRRIWNGEVEEQALFAVLDDPASDYTSRWHALTGLARVHGDDARAAKVIRSTMNDPALRDMEGFQMCVEALVARVRVQARSDLGIALESRYSTVRSAALNGLAYIGETSHYDDMFPLFKRAVTRGQKGAGGFRLADLGVYLLSCVLSGTGDFDEIKALLRTNWSKIPANPSDDIRGLFEKLLPQIGDETTELPRIGLPTLEFPKYKRPG